jgi:hypothetical protein
MTQNRKNQRKKKPRRMNALKIKTIDSGTIVSIITTAEHHQRSDRQGRVKVEIAGGAELEDCYRVARRRVKEDRETAKPKSKLLTEKTKKKTEGGNIKRPGDVVHFNSFNERPSVHCVFASAKENQRRAKTCCRQRRPANGQRRGRCHLSSEQIQHINNTENRKEAKMMMGEKREDAKDTKTDVEKVDPVNPPPK